MKCTVTGTPWNPIRYCVPGIAVLRELGLSNESANKLMPLAAKLIDRHIESVEDEFGDLKKGWAAATLV
jgi:hypothetical protein